MATIPALNIDQAGVCQCESVAPNAEPLHGGILIALTHCQAENTETAIKEYLRIASTETDAARASNHALELIHDVIETLLDEHYHATDHHEPIERSG